MPFRKHDISVRATYNYDGCYEDDFYTIWYDVYLVYPTKFRYLDGLKKGWDSSIYRPQRIATFVTSKEDDSKLFFMQKMMAITLAHREAYELELKDSEILDHLRKTVGCYEEEVEGNTHIWCLFNVKGELLRHWW